MMKSFLVPAATVFLLAACGRDEPPTDGTSVEPPAAEAATAAAEPYPLEVCLVSGEELGSMGEPVVIVHEGREVKFCCDSCVPKFEENPEKYLGKLGQPES